MYFDRNLEEKDTDVVLGNDFTVCKRCVEKEKEEHPEKLLRHIEEEMQGKFSGQKLAAVVPEQDVYLCANCLKELFAKVSGSESSLSVLDMDIDKVMAEVQNNGNSLEEETND